LKFIEKIIHFSELKEAKLYSAAHKCFDKPDTGITIQHQGAYNVIKDCAYVTTRYLPHFIFGAYVNPFESLKGKFTKIEIEEFVKKSRDDYALNQLLNIILFKIENENIVKQSENKKSSPAKEADFSSTDPYGMYGEGDEEVVEDVDVQLSDVEILCKAFSVS
jgi:hypothetical protein